MSKIILHHYPQSPFAEKIRTILGYKRLEWWSVDVPMVPPRPSLDHVFDGFRRIPALQIGADFFTDTRLIAEVLDQIEPSPPLHTPQSEGIDTLMSSWVEPRVFVMAGPVRMAAPPADSGFSDPAVRERFARDRIPFMAPLVDATRFGELRPTAEHHLTRYLEGLTSLIGGSRFIGGEQPVLADFSAYTIAYWLLRAPAVPLVMKFEAVTGWADRMTKIGHGRRHEADVAFSASAHKEGQSQKTWRGTWPEINDPWLGKTVSAVPDDCGRTPIVGTLVQATTRHVVIERDVPSGGKARIHVPRFGFEITLAAPEKS
jgi:glutathione S-transferase